MWVAVTERFTQFLGNLKLTDDQIDDGQTKYNGVTKCLNKNYYDSISETANSMLVGSWGKHTRMRPPRDVDVLYRLPASVYERFEKRTGNKQSALLQEVKDVLSVTYPSTTMRGDGQVVLVKFNTINVEVLPAFLLDSGKYWICDTHDGGSYKETDPVAEQQNMTSANSDSNGNARKLTKFLKCWQRVCNVPLKSFWLELLAIDFLSTWEYRKNSPFYHDWMCRDFFKFLCGKRNSYVIVPGTYEIIWLGEEWFTKAESARERAIKAEDYDRQDLIALAGEEWQKIFDTYIPMIP